ncbi:MAG: InlB B-repeat-containing protein [Chloroflexota bacterium]
MKLHRTKWLLVLLFGLLAVLGRSSVSTSFAEAEAQPGDGDTGAIQAEEYFDSAEIPPLENGQPYQFPITSYRNIEAEPQSPTSLGIEVWYGTSQSFGQLGIPQTWANILGTVVGATENTTLSYKLNGGPAQPLSIGPDTQRLYNAGDFNIELAFSDLLPGANTVQIMASDGGAQANESVTVNYTAGVTWPLNYSIHWAGAGSVTNVSQVVDGRWEIDSGELRNVTPGYDRLVDIGDLGWTDYEVTVPVTVESLNDTEWGPPSNGAGVGFIAGWQGHYQLDDNEQPGTGWRRALGSLAWFRWNTSGGANFQMRGYGGSTVLDTSDEQIALNTTYMFKLSVQSSPIDGFPSTYRFKYWPVGDPEPALWTMESQGIVGEPETGSLLLVAHQAIVRFGDVTVTPISSIPAPKIKVQSSNNGHVVLTPDKPSYNYGETVTARAVGDSGYVLSNWSGSLSGDQNPMVFDITQDMTIKANFTAGANPTLTVTVDGNGAVDVTPDKDEYQYGEIAVLTPKPNPGYLFAGWAGDLTGTNNPAEVVMTSNKVISASFVPANTNSPVSDDFNSCTLNTDLWTFVNPVGDGTYSVNGEQLILTAPGGLSHNIWLEGNRSVRVVQPTDNSNFEIVTKFDSVVSKRFQMQGILVEQDNKNFLRFEIHHDGASVQAYAAKFIDGVPEPVVSKIPLSSTPSWLRITRTGDDWSFSYSFDGTEWFSAGSFVHELTVTSTGVFSGNHSSGDVPPPEHQAVVDYFFNSTSPIEPEDGKTIGINVSVQGEGTVTRNPDLPQYTCGDTVTLTAEPETGWTFAGWSGDVTGTTPVKEVTITGAMDAVATFTPLNGGYKTYLPSVLSQ